MKVLHVIPSVSPLRGGPSEMIGALVRGLAQRGHLVRVATTDDDGNGRTRLANTLVADGAVYRYFPRQTRFYTFSWPLTVWLARHVREFDLVHIHALFSYAALPAAYWARRQGIPYIVRPLGVLNRWGMQQRRPWVKKISYRLIEKNILNGAAAVEYSCEQECREAAQLGFRQKPAVIANPVDQPSDAIAAARGRFRARHGQLAERCMILFLSRLDAKKGLDLLLPAFAAVRAQNSHAFLVIAGSGDAGFIAQLRRQAEWLGIARDILWTGFLSGADKWAALADADIFVLPSYSENFGVAVVEAMAAGLPVVISDQVGIHREVSAAGAGAIVPCDGAQLTRALTELVANRALRATMSLHALRLAQEHFSAAAAIEKLLDLYHEVCRTNAAAADAAS